MLHKKVENSLYISVLLCLLLIYNFLLQNCKKMTSWNHMMNPFCFLEKKIVVTYFTCQKLCNPAPVTHITETKRTGARENSNILKNSGSK